MIPNLSPISRHALYLGRVKRIWYLSPLRAAKVQASLRTRAVSPEPPLLAHTSSESRGTFRQKARSLAPLNGWAYAVKICHDGMLEDTNSLDAANFIKIHSHLQVLYVIIRTETYGRRTDGHTDGQRETLILRRYLGAGFRK